MYDQVMVNSHIEKGSRDLNKREGDVLWDRDCMAIVWIMNVLEFIM